MVEAMADNAHGFDVKEIRYRSQRSGFTKKINGSDVELAQISE